MESNKAIDWQLALQLTNDQADLAKDLLELLVSELPQNRTQINQALMDEDFTLMQRVVHKLHGAACYCGVPRLKDIAASLEEQLQLSQASEVKKLVIKINDEIDRVILSFKQNNYEQL